MTAKKYRTLGVGDKRPEGYELRFRLDKFKKGDGVGMVISHDDFSIKEYRAPIVKRKKAGKKK